MPPRQTLTLKSISQANDNPLAEKSLKIAIVGSGASSLDAPFKDESWTIWAFSRKQFNALPRFDKWFELHDKHNFQAYEMRDKLKGYTDFLKGENVVLQAAFPREELEKRFGTWFFQTSQVGWLMAYAIQLGAETIGLWGIDAIGPYKQQRLELQHFCQMAKDLGIKIIVPEGCTLLEPAQVYAFR